LTGPGLTGDQLRAVGQIPNLPQTFLATLENLSNKSRGSLKPGDVATSEMVPQLIEILSGDYDRVCPDLISASQRSTKLRLLAAACSMLLPDLKSREISALLLLICKLLNAAVTERALKIEEQVCILKLLTAFLNRVPDKAGDRLGDILGYLCILSGLARTGKEVCLIPTNLPHLQFSQQDGNRRESSCTNSSGSEFSDQEMVGEGEGRRRREEMVLEKEALAAIYTFVVKCHKKEVVSFWYIFLPDKCFCPIQNGVSVLLRHPMKKVRTVAINIMVEFVNHSHQFLALAQHQDKGGSYTSLSAALALSLLHLHRTLLDRIHEPLGNTEYVALLKLFSILAENCTYSRLEAGLLDREVNALMELADRERNPVIQVAVLSVFVALGSPNAVQELKPIAREMFGFILPRALPVPQTQVADNNVRYMALQALSVLAQLDIQMFIKSATGIKKLIDTSLVDADSSVVLHTFRFIKNFAKYLTEAAVQNQETESRLKNLTCAFWIDFLKPANFQLLEDRHANANLRSAFCDCLGEIGPGIFAELPEPKRIVAITYLLGQCRNTLDAAEFNKEMILQDRAALSSCLRTLGIYVTFPCYLTDSAFHIDVTDAILPHLPVKLKEKGGAKVVQDPGYKTIHVSASWALANLTDILVQAKSEFQRTGEFDEFPAGLIKKILECGIICAQSSGAAVNTKSNSVRCIGNMLNYISPDLISDTEYQEMMGAGTKAIISNIQSGKIMKIRWNACYASANLLRKEKVKDSSGPWVGDLTSCLSQIVLNFQNFKVRINAAYALSCAWGREVFGSNFFSVFQALISSLESAQNLEVFGEWQHQANLVNQLCISICRLLSFVQNQAEFSRCVGLMFENWDVVESSFKAAAPRISPDKFAPILEASNHLAAFQSRKEEEKELQDLLRECAENTDGL